ncbi:hypothetical protein TBK1r_58530 [Stieleria magnilauensis]|uniref:Uncharacterized protein n=1 Tax=Stieleria magnilauensis TaxID=2527963 RepID=A0ABX5XXT6_9BACT|nr:hypothetical protein TBK1r_58530 [Planctomycetes bacterium TBK1r]
MESTRKPRRDCQGVVFVSTSLADSLPSQSTADTTLRSVTMISLRLLQVARRSTRVTFCSSHFQRIKKREIPATTKRSFNRNRNFASYTNLSLIEVVRVVAHQSRATGVIGLKKKRRLGADFNDNLGLPTSLHGVPRASTARNRLTFRTVVPFERYRLPNHFLLSANATCNRLSISPKHRTCTS